MSLSQSKEIDMSKQEAREQPINEWLEHERLPHAKTAEDFEALLPFRTFDMARNLCGSSLAYITPGVVR
jgi:hypothetical protein